MSSLSFETILKIITAFYDKATFDVMIGYHFRGIEDFKTHLPRIASFWQLQLTGKMDHKEELPFDLINVHRPLMVKRAQIDRWVLLFEQNLYDCQVDDKTKKLWMDKVDHFKEKLKSGLAS